MGFSGIGGWGGAVCFLTSKACGHHQGYYENEGNKLLYRYTLHLNDTILSL